MRNRAMMTRWGVIAGLLVAVSSRSHAGGIVAEPYAGLDTGGRGRITALAFSGQGGYLLSGDDRGTVRCWDLAAKRTVTTIELRGAIAFVDFLAEENTVVTVEKSGQVSVRSLLGGDPAFAFKTTGAPLRVALDAGRQLLAVATDKRRLQIVDLEARMPAGTIDAGERLGTPLFLGFDRRGEELVAISERGAVSAWNPATQQLIRQVILQGHELHGSRSVIQSAATNRAANLFVVGMQEVALPRGGLSGATRPGDLVRTNRVVACDWQGGAEIKEIKVSGRTDGIALGPGNDNVAAFNRETRTVTVLDLRRAEAVHSVSLEDEPEVVVVSADDRWLVAGTSTGRISVWALRYEETSAGGEGTAPKPAIGGRIRSLSGDEPALPGDQEATLAVLPFEARDVPSSVGAVCLDVISSSLANLRHLTLVERGRINDAIGEMKLSLMGVTDQNGAELGKMLNAELVLLGSVSSLGNNYLFSARLLEVETGKVIQGRQVLCEECREQDVFDAIRLLAWLIAR